MQRLPLWTRYAWASPYTAVGLLLGGLMWLSGGAAERHNGTLEFAGGALGRFFSRFSFGAITLGHVILAIDDVTLAALRQHERVHVAQYERWGVFFVPAYLLSSAFQLLRGRHPYRENHFEVQACTLSMRRRAPSNRS